MINDTVFEIPVYSCSQSEFNSRITRQVDRLMATVPNRRNDIWEEQRNDELKRQLRSVRFNEIVGYIEVYLFGSQLRADLWFSDKSRIIPGSRSKGILTRRGKLLEKHFQPHKMMTSEEIFAEFRRSLERAVRKNRILRRRYVDFKAFDRCGEFVDWKKMITDNLARGDA